MCAKNRPLWPNKTPTSLVFLYESNRITQITVRSLFSLHQFDSSIYTCNLDSSSSRSPTYLAAFPCYLDQTQATNPYLLCGSGSGKRCGFPLAIKDVCESIVAALSVFLPFLFNSWEESHGVKWIHTGSGRFHTRATADCYTSPMGGGGDREEAPKRKKRFWLHNTIKQMSKHGAYYNLVQLEFTCS